MAFMFEWRVASERCLRKWLRVKSRQLQTSLIGILIIVVVVTLSGSSQSRRSERPAHRTIADHSYLGITDVSINPSLETLSIPQKIIRHCQDERLETLFFVHTSPEHFTDRQDFRQYLHRPPELAVVFMLGSSEDPGIASKVIQEAAQFQDMVVFGSFIDSYRNLTLKFVKSIRWLQRTCGDNSHLKTFVKLDDDVWLNLPMLKSYLRYEIAKRPDRIHCLVWRRVRVARRLTSKWFVSKSEYALPYYPPYCGGLAYIVPRGLLSRLVEASYRVPFFWVDDVYATGLLARQAHIGHAQMSMYYAFRVNESVPIDETAGWLETMTSTFGTTDVMFAHMNTAHLRHVRNYLFAGIDESPVNYNSSSKFNVF